MIYKTEDAFAKDIKADKLYPVYLIYGQESYLKTLYVSRLADKAVNGGFSDFNFNKVEGKKLSMDELYDSVEALPLMADRRCVLVEDLEIDKLSLSDNKKLLEIIESPPDTTVLILLMREVILDEKKSAKTKKFIEAIDKAGAAIALNGRDTAQLVRFVRQLCDKAKCQLEGDNAAYLVDRCGTDMGILSNECQKLCAYANGSEITKEMIDKITTQSIEAVVYDLSKALLRGDYYSTMTILSDLLYLKEQPVTILSVLSYSFIDLYRAKIARNSGRTAEEVVEDFDYKRKEFRIKNAMRDCTKYSLELLSKLIDLTANADYRLKSSRVDNRIILEQYITEVFAELKSEGRF